MRILIADDDRISRLMLKSTLTKWGYEVIETCDGNQALSALEQENAPPLAILDWMMPEMHGVEICRNLREISNRDPIYIILLTSKGSREDIIAGLQAGADDYVIKPFDPEELLARVQVGARVVGLQSELADRVEQLELVLSQVKQLQGFLPICSYCKKIRDDQDYWQQVENYIERHSEALFTHSICPDCYEEFVKPELEELRRLKLKKEGQTAQLPVSGRE